MNGWGRLPCFCYDVCMSSELQTKEIRIGRRSTIVIPVEMRKALGIGDGDRLQATVCDGRLTLTPIPADPFERLRRAGSKFYNGVDAVAYIRQLRDEWDD